jgi:hypothetical protein
MPFGGSSDMEAETNEKGRSAGCGPESGDGKPECPTGDYFAAANSSATFAQLTTFQKASTKSARRFWNLR